MANVTLSSTGLPRGPRLEERIPVVLCTASAVQRKGGGTSPQNEAILEDIGGHFCREGSPLEGKGTTMRPD